MLTTTDYSISTDILQEAQQQLPIMDNRLVLNQSTGDFFYDPWKIKPEFADTVWAQILDSLSETQGEARLIKLAPGEAYPSHADIDDRWHLTITGDRAYLIDLDADTMYPTDPTGHWQLMDAGIRHSAVNFGAEDRLQLVVRKPLIRNILKNPIQVHLTLKKVVGDRRFIFDDVISPWLNRAYKQGTVGNFDGQDLIATFDIEVDCLDELEKITRDYFIVIIDV
jgi:hypothetical protein